MPRAQRDSSPHLEDISQVGRALLSSCAGSTLFPKWQIYVQNTNPSSQTHLFAVGLAKERVNWHLSQAPGLVFTNSWVQSTGGKWYYFSLSAEGNEAERDCKVTCPRSQSWSHTPPRSFHHSTLSPKYFPNSIAFHMHSWESRTRPMVSQIFLCRKTRAITMFKDTKNSLSLHPLLCMCFLLFFNFFIIFLCMCLS